MNIIRCSHCGTANRVGSYFCNRCGTDLRAQEDFQETSEEGESATTAPSTQSTTGAHSEPAAAANTTASDATTTGRRDSQPEGDADRSPSQGREQRFKREQNRGEGSPSQTDAQQRFVPPLRQQTHPLVEGIHGLLDPIRIANDLSNDETGEQSFVTTPRLTVPITQLRRIRALIAEDPTLVEHTAPPSLSAQVRLRYPWLIILLLLAIGLPLLLQLSGPVGEARRWPGVAEAYAMIDALPEDQNVWIFWAYDPATAGEMDLVAHPLVDHLLEHSAQATIITLLPTGLATAQRLWASTAEGVTIERGLGTQNGSTVFVEGAYLPGGAPALSLLAASPVDALWGHTERATNWLSYIAAQRPALTVVVAARPEDVQHWLELVQTETNLPVVAFVGAGADPVLRPYFASGQLAGLVSGFDGAAAYQQLRDHRFGRLPSARYTMQLIAQNCGHVVLILVLLLGNLRALWLGGKRG